jgi:ATP-dependent Lon protease
MSQHNFFNSREEESDFMPIIPFNDEDFELDNGLVVPEVLPILPLRNTVLFPGVVLPITVGRDKSIQAVNDAYKGEKLIGVVAQKDASIEEPVAEDLCTIGTVAKIVKLIKMPDGGTTIIIQGKKRFALGEMVPGVDYFKGAIQILPDQPIPESEEFKAQVSTIKDLATQIIQLSPNIPTEAGIVLKNIENPTFLVNFVSSNLNSELQEKQHLLELDQVQERTVHLIKILQKEFFFK